MNVMLVSLILALTLTITQVGDAIAPPPLDRLAHALASARSYRVVYVDTETTGNTMGITTWIVVRHGATVQTYATLAIGAGGQKPQLLTEHIETGTQACNRPAHVPQWQCRPWHRATHADLMHLAKNPALTRLHWVAMPDATVNGQRCQGYRTTWQSAAGTRTRATVWIARSSGRPVEVVATTVEQTAGAGSTRTPNTIRETATWDEWNSPALHIPRP